MDILAKIWIVFLVVVTVIFLWYVSFNLEKWFNYKFGYQSKVEERILPLEKRIEELEKLIKK